jgi:hypothetical protein
MPHETFPSCVYRDGASKLVHSDKEVEDAHDDGWTDDPPVAEQLPVEPPPQGAHLPAAPPEATQLPTDDDEPSHRGGRYGGRKK